MGFRISGGSYPALTRALGVRGQSSLQLSTVAQVSYSPAAAGQLAFAGAPYSAYEGSTLTFSVARNVGATGTIAVDWAITVSEGAPSPAAGTISWNNGEAGTKSVNVTAGLVTADRTATITLSNPRAVGGGTAPTIVGGTTATATIRNDTTAPTAPVLGTPSLVGTTATVPLNTPSTDAHSGLALYSLEQAIGAGAFSEIASGLTIFPRTVSGLNQPTTTYNYRARARDTASNFSGYSPTVQVTTPNSGPAITSWANFNLGVNAVNGIDFTAQDYPIWTPNNGVYHTYFANGGWDNGPRVRIMGSQVAQTACGLGSFVNIWRNGSVPIRRFYLRFQCLFGPTLAQNWTGADWKFVIIHTSPTLLNQADPGGGERPMMNFVWDTSVNTSDSRRLAWAIGASTFKQFNPNPPPNLFGPTADCDFFVGNIAGTYSGKPVIGPGEWLNFEMDCICESTAEAPNGHIRGRVTRRNGQAFTLTIPWNYDSNWTVGDYVHAVQLIGGFWNNAVNASDAGTYYELQNIVMGANQSGLLGPPAGFVTG